MPSKERQILERVKTQIQNVNGSGSYSYDLSASDRVVFGDRFAPEALPCAYVNLIDINTAQEPGRTLLKRYDRTMQIQIEAWAAVTSSTAGQSILEGCDLMDDIMRALESGRLLSTANSTSGPGWRLRFCFVRSFTWRTQGHELV